MHTNFKGGINLKETKLKMNYRKWVATMGMATMLFSSFAGTGFAANEANAIQSKENSSTHNTVAYQETIDLEDFLRIYATQTPGVTVESYIEGYKLTINIPIVYQAYNEGRISMETTTVLGLIDIINNYEMFLESVGEEFVIIYKDKPSTHTADMYILLDGEMIFVHEFSYAELMQNEVVEDFGDKFVRGEPNFIDIKGHWAENAIVMLYKLGVANGTSETKFSPNVTMTRAQFAAMLSRTLVYEESAVKDLAQPFTDAKGHWAEKDIKILAALGIISGTSPTTVAPNKEITREQAAAMIQRYLEALDVVPNVPATSNFADSHKISPYAKEGVGLLANMGIIGGKGNNQFDPHGKLTRAEMSKILWGVIAYDYSGTNK